MKVLLAVDGSIHALHACKFLTAFPLPQPVQVEILTVVNPPEVVMSAQSELWYPQFIEHQEEIARQAISSGERAIRGLDAEVSTHQMMGHIGHCIVERATEENIDLVVVAAKGHSAFERVLLGSVSDYVATHAPCSVLVVRQEIPEDRGVNDEIPPASFRRGMIAVDERGVSDAMLNELCRYSWTDQHELTTVTASVKLEVFREDILASTMEEAARRRTEARRCADAAAARLSACGAKATGASVEVEHVGYGLVQYAEQNSQDIVVVGDSGRGLISRMLLGSTSRYVLHHVHCSVLVVRKAKKQKA
ncbi:nucleotide-binding universal stress UspA family protein [Rhodopirellula rubra]|uniref:Nucleotide-binding universal stress UspA family protein n=1 Tax=Aporhodopirellula rubra TaxID=980271 RepID=A0A7W5DVF5_9BACT|nr:universal stress protein [Aporhodopirellula rubra]MBB3205274.1 nucleotide-binding universal stress UspA family protein [Aporhodopirellula rubra]